MNAVPPELRRVINHRLRGDAFLKYVHGGLVCLGTVLLLQAVRAG